MSQPNRNDPCPCGSGKKYKKCCMGRSGRRSFPVLFSSRNGVVYLLLAGIFFLSIFLRYDGFRREHGLTFDEGLYAHLLAPQLQQDPTDYSTQEAYRRMTQQADRHLPAYLDRPLFKHPPLYSYLIALNYRFFGRSDLAAVSVSILLGCLMVPIVFLLGKLLYDERVGLLAAAFLCIEPTHWVCSERIWMETTLSFFMLSGIFLFALAGKRKSYPVFILSGISIGLAMSTKYPAALDLLILGSFALFFNRSLLREKGFWSLCLAAVLVLTPWIIWNAKVYGNLDAALVSAHQLSFHKESAATILSAHKGALIVLLCLAGSLLAMRRKIGSFLSREPAQTWSWGRKNLVPGLYVFIFILLGVAAPFFRETVKEAFVWKNTVQVGWSNPFFKGPWYFYLTRLVELSPLYMFAYLAFPFLAGKDRGDQLLVWSCFWILAAFILLGNYQSRYILPAVPFLAVLSARWQVWAYDKLAKAGPFKIALRVTLVGIILYFTAQTLKADSLLAIGPDFGYF